MLDVDEWEGAGRRIDVAGRSIFVADLAAAREELEPLLVLHGFPTCSFDFRHVVPRLRTRRRVVLVDMLGYGLSDKPLDVAYSLFDQADVVEGCARAAGIERAALLTHDMGDSVGGELLARALEGRLPFEITKRVLTNGSIYMDLVQLSPGQQLLLALPDAALPPDQALTEELFAPSLAATFGADTQPSADELSSQWRLVERAGGNRLLPRLIRYVDERRMHEGRWTGAIEKHESPLTIVWGDADPIAVYPMAERLSSATGAPIVRLEGIGHYPMIETPDRFAAAVETALS